MNKRVTPEHGPGLDQQRLIRQIQRRGDTRREGLKREADLRVQVKDPSSVPAQIKTIIENKCIVK